MNTTRTLLEDANVPHLQRHKIIQEAIITATKLDGLVTTNVGKECKTRYELFGYKNPAFTRHLRTWGEAGVVKIASKTSPKLRNKGVTCAFVGYAENHVADCHRMWEPIKHYVYVTRDIIWLKRMCHSKNEASVHDPHRTIDVSISVAGENQENETTETEEQPTITPSKTKVTIGKTTFMPVENSDNKEDDGEWEQPPTEEPYHEVKRSRADRTTHPVKL